MPKLVAPRWQRHFWKAKNQWWNHCPGRKTLCSCRNQPGPAACLCRGAAIGRRESAVRPAVDRLGGFLFRRGQKTPAEKTVSAIQTNRHSPDAAFWLASALWREREKTRRISYLPTPTRLAPNPLTNDFTRLLQWFPESYEAKREITDHGEGSYVYTEIKDRRYLDIIFDYGSGLRTPPVPKPSKTEPAIQLTSRPRRYRRAEAGQAQ